MLRRYFLVQSHTKSDMAGELELRSVHALNGVAVVVTCLPLLQGLVLLVVE